MNYIALPVGIHGQSGVMNDLLVKIARQFPTFDVLQTCNQRY